MGGSEGASLLKGRRLSDDKSKLFTHLADYFVQLHTERNRLSLEWPATCINQSCPERCSAQIMTPAPDVELAPKEFSFQLHKTGKFYSTLQLNFSPTFHYNQL